LLHAPDVHCSLPGSKGAPPPHACLQLSRGLKMRARRGELGHPIGIGNREQGSLLGRVRAKRALRHATHR